MYLQLLSNDANRTVDYGLKQALDIQTQNLQYNKQNPRLVSCYDPYILYFRLLSGSNPPLG